MNADTDVTYDPDARLGGNDDPVLLEKLHVEAEQVKPKRTRYQVEVRVEQADETPELWSPFAVVDASGARDAIRQVALINSTSYPVGKGDVLRAIPVRNITQLTLDVETTTKLRLS